ncbi:hypothetical protein [Alicyclobacillus fodiniaquatilis]|uniref:HTH HARE-type domain-containing protein n=1 Tax=Alicyclobacillus fodiniaquatilis TaxID=1661150 RepID=A0ABW4JF07_9BACL
MSWTQGQHREQYPDDNRGNYKHSSGSANRRDYNSNKRDSGNTRNDRPNQEEVAATFTQQGLATFSEIFGSAVEKAIAKELPSVVSQAVAKELSSVVRQAVEESIERKMFQAIRLVKEEIIGDLLTHVSNILEESTREKVSAMETAAAAVQVTEEYKKVNESAENSGSTPKVKTGNNDVDAVIALLKQKGQPVKFDEIKNLLPDLKWGSNPSVKMSNMVIHSMGQINRLGKGFYEYNDGSKHIRV